MAGMDIAKIAGILIILFFVLWFVTGILWTIIWWVIRMGVIVFVIYFAWHYLRKRFSSWIKIQLQIKPGYCFPTYQIRSNDFPHISTKTKKIDPAGQSIDFAHFRYRNVRIMLCRFNCFTQIFWGIFMAYFHVAGVADIYDGGIWRYGCCKSGIANFYNDFQFYGYSALCGYGRRPYRVSYSCKRKEETRSYG